MAGLYALGMTLTINGEPRNLSDGLTVAALIDTLELRNAACAVEVNRRLVPKREHETATLRDGDTVEVVVLVGGG